MKADKNDGGKFYGVFPDTFWSPGKVDVPIYDNSMQSQLRKLIMHVTVRTFAQMTYKIDLSGKYLPTFPMHADMMIDSVIELVKKSLPKPSSSRKSGKWVAVSVEDRFLQLVDQITTGYIAELCLDLTHTFRANKNWNWHGATVGATMGAIASLLNALRNGKLDENFRQKIPKGVVLTGSKHGHHDAHYVEYMTSEIETNPILGNSANYLDHVRFRKEKHDDKVKAIMDVTQDFTVPTKGIEGGAVADSMTFKHPTPRPTRSHTVDFAVTYKGVHLLDGECKDAGTNCDANVLVLHSLDQLAYKNEALGLLTTSQQFTLYLSEKKQHSGRISTTYYDLASYYLGPVTDLTQDLDKNDDQSIDVIPTYWVANTITGGDVGTEVREDVGSEIDQIWKGMRTEPRYFIKAVLSCIDVLCYRFSLVQLDKVAEARKESYGNGFVEPRFLSTRESELKSRREIKNPNNFLYNKENMEGVKVNVQHHVDMVDDLDSLMNNYEMSDELRQSMQILKTRHKAVVEGENT